MGGIFSKNRRLRVFPKKVTFFKAKGRKTQGTACTSQDASTWTGENHFHSARIGRTQKALEASPAEKLESDAAEGQPDAQAPGEQAASVHAQHAEPPCAATAQGAQDAEEPREAEPDPEELQQQQAAEQAPQAAQSGKQSPREAGMAPAALQPACGSLPHAQVTHDQQASLPVAQTTVRVEVHVSADIQGGPCGIQPATGIPPETGMLSLVEEATVKCVSEDMCAEKPHQYVPVQNAAESPAAPSTMGELEPSAKTAEAREGITDLQNSTEEQMVDERDCCAAAAPPDPQAEQDTEASATENGEENSLEPEQAEEMTDSSNGQTAKEILCCQTGTQAVLCEEEAGMEREAAYCGDCSRAPKEPETGCSEHPAD